MPTSYTAPIYEGQEITFEDFALRCARAMGASIEQRDESLDVPLRKMETSGGYHSKGLARANVALKTARKRDTAEWEKLQEAEIREAIEYRTKYLEDRKALRERYTAMLYDVTEWEPPTPEHEGLKKFMRQQIEESINFDCGSYDPPVPERLPVSEYRSQQIEKCAREVSYHAEKLAKEHERVRSQHAWVTALYRSLGKEPA